MVLSCSETLHYIVKEEQDIVLNASALFLWSGQRKNLNIFIKECSRFQKLVVNFKKSSSYMGDLPKTYMNFLMAYSCTFSFLLSSFRFVTKNEKKTQSYESLRTGKFRFKKSKHERELLMQAQQNN